MQRRAPLLGWARQPRWGRAHTGRAQAHIPVRRPYFFHVLGLYLLRMRTPRRKSLQKPQTRRWQRSTTWDWKTADRKWWAESLWPPCLHSRAWLGGRRAHCSHQLTRAADSPVSREPQRLRKHRLGWLWHPLSCCAGLSSRALTQTPSAGRSFTTLFNL